MYAQSKRSTRALKIINLISFIGVLILNFLANYLPLNGNSTGELSDIYPNLLVPIGFTFSIWGVIYLFLAAFIIYQFTSSKVIGLSNKTVVDRVGIFFLISSLGNMSWIVLWHYENVLGSLIALLVMLVSLAAIYIRVNSNTYQMSRGEKWFVKYPFSIYLGWITLATILNLTALFVDMGWNGISFVGQLWSVFIYIVLIGISFFVLKTKKDILFNLVYIWALFGVAYKHMEVFNSEYILAFWGSIATMIVIILLILKSLFLDRRNQDIFKV